MSHPAAVDPARRRGREWVVLGLVLGLVLTYLVIWSVYAAAHVYPRYQQLPPGAIATATDQSAHYRLVSLKSTENITTKYGDNEPAEAGTVWVVASLEVTIDAPADLVKCSLPLLGPDGRIWDGSIDAPSRTLPTYCSSEKVTVGQPYAFEQLYRVPTGFADQLRGVVVVNNLTTSPSQVLSPAG